MTQDRKYQNNYGEPAWNWFSRIKSIIWLFSLIYSLNLNAQQATVPAGAVAKGVGGTVSYSVGQLSTIINTGEDGVVMPGVQQPFEIMVITETDMALDIQLSVFPNPTQAWLNLKVDVQTMSRPNLQLFNVQGKCLRSQRLTDDHTTIPMKNLPPGAYFLKVYDGSKLVKTFKVLKN